MLWPLTSLACLVCLMGGAPRSLPRDPMDEYFIKAKLIKGLAEFSTWPPSTEAMDKSKPFVLAVLGQSPFEGYLETLYQHQSIKGKSVRISYLRDIQKLEKCDMLFICTSESDRLAFILPHIKGKAILTVGDTPRFASRGVMFNFYMAGNLVKLEFSPSALQAEGIEASSHLLKLARRVE